jgi:leucyl aminopeptidase
MRFSQLKHVSAVKHGIEVTKAPTTTQCTVSSEADHILAAVFLSKFVAKDVHWIHLDLAPANKPGKQKKKMRFHKVGIN